MSELYLPYTCPIRWASGFQDGGGPISGTSLGSVVERACGAGPKSFPQKKLQPFFPACPPPVDLIPRRVGRVQPRRLNGLFKPDHFASRVEHHREPFQRPAHPGDFHPEFCNLNQEFVFHAPPPRGARPGDRRIPRALTRQGDLANARLAALGLDWFAGARCFHCVAGTKGCSAGAEPRIALAFFRSDAW